MACYWSSIFLISNDRGLVQSSPLPQLSSSRELRWALLLRTPGGAVAAQLQHA